MTNNPVNFMKKNFTNWFNAKTNGVKVDSVFVIPCEKEHPDYQVLVADGARIFKECEWGHFLKRDNFCIQQVTSEGKEFFLYWHKDLEPKKIQHEFDVGLTQDDCHFLLKLGFYTTCDLEPISALEGLVTSGTIFESDLISCLPHVLIVSLDKKHVNENFYIKVMRVLLYVELLDRRHDYLYENIIELALSLPEKDHVWLYYEVMRAVRSKNQESVFLSLYKLLEFFFPLNNVFALSGSIHFEGSLLKLLDHCKQDLNWNVNHNYGLRATKDYASHRFAHYLGYVTSDIDIITDVVEKNKKIDNIKTDALDKISKLRHKLTHQNFCETDISSNELEDYTTALTIFLTESFKEYCNRIKDDSATNIARRTPIYENNEQSE
ncbi:hypothetical protein SMB77_001596 [Cronobacter sakazakii]|uniref:hypothetical protein n=2 Tax=Cronobacter sakazakii TaxID=28141 RepID=UPI000CF0B48A|nr:hypothetical protein [Cronobacter sakazakii]ELY2616897.1 hypothetical protein [Cronobacter sakazakii]ELY2632738.1 hypothetical protein [Cronobacter sakazakii]ELY2662972.1 hypothetical protein [Cronobacter sakazakii]ELY6233201.1 hypothetical protein [Cronobacter sakazakii]ELY6348379.1 hypothetical protein [Cronobacter sakazakii]